MRTSAFFTLMALWLFGGISGAYAQKSFVKTGEQVQVSEQIAGNAYVTGGKIQVDSEVKGDLIGAGGSIRVQGKVYKDIVLAGGEIYMDAEAGEDLRIAGGKIQINQNVAGDLTITGGEITIAEGVTINGDVFIAGGKLWLDGNISGDLHLAGGEVFLKGRVAGNLKAHTGKLHLGGTVAGASKIIAQEFFVDSGARLEGDVVYWSKQGKQDLGDALANGASATYDASLRPKYNEINWEKGAKSGLMAFFAFRIVSGIVLILALIGLFSRFFAERAGLARKFAARSFVRGLGVLIGLPLVSGIAMISIVGIPLGIVGFSAFTAFAMSAGALTSVVAAFELSKWKQWPMENGKLFFLSAGIFLGLRLVGVMPVIGGLFNFVLTAIAVGHIIRHFHQTAPVEDLPVSEGTDSDLV